MIHAAQRSQDIEVRPQFHDLGQRRPVGDPLARGSRPFVRRPQRRVGPGQLPGIADRAEVLDGSLGLLTGEEGRQHGHRQPADGGIGDAEKIVESLADLISGQQRENAAQRGQPRDFLGQRWQAALVHGVPVSRALFLGRQRQGQVQDPLEVHFGVQSGRERFPEHGQGASAERVGHRLAEQLRLDDAHRSSDLRLIGALGYGLQQDELTDHVAGPEQDLDDRSDLLRRQVLDGEHRGKHGRTCGAAGELVEHLLVVRGSLRKGRGEERLRRRHERGQGGGRPERRRRGRIRRRG